MALQVNTQSSVDALGTLAQADAASAQAFQTTVDSIQKMRENKEWASEEQKKMRSSKAKAETAAADKSFNLDKAQGDFIGKNPELYQELERAGVLSETAKKWQQMDTAEGEMFGKLFATIDAEDPDQVKAAVTAGLKNPATRAMTSRLPSAGALISGDPKAIAEFKVLQGSWFMNAKHQQAMAQGATQQGYTKDNINLQGNIESKQIDQRGRIEERLQGARLYHDAQQGGLDRNQRGSQFDRSFDQGADQFKQEMQYKYDALSSSIEEAKIRASAKGKTGKPLKPAEALGENTTNWKEKTLVNMVNGRLKAMGADEIPEEVVKKAAVEIGDQAISDYNKSIANGNAPASPQMIADTLVDYYIATGRLKVTPDYVYDDAEMTDNDTAAVNTVFSALPKDSGIGQDQVAETLNKLKGNPQFMNMNQKDKDNMLYQVLTRKK